MSNPYLYKRNDIGLGGCLIVLGLLVLLWAVMVGLFTLAWNFVMPPLFGLPNIEFWQSAALVFIIGVLTSGLRGSASK